MRLFTETSFYVKMLVRCIYDIRWFMVMLALCVTAFAFGGLIIGNREERHYEELEATDSGAEHEPLTDNMFDNTLID